MPRYAKKEKRLMLFMCIVCLIVYALKVALAEKVKREIPMCSDYNEAECNELMCWVSILIASKITEMQTNTLFVSEISECSSTTATIKSRKQRCFCSRLVTGK